MRVIYKASFYSLHLELEYFGTQGRLVINAWAQVLNTDGEVINGTYAIDYYSATVLPTYLVPTMLFGGRSMCEK